MRISMCLRGAALLIAVSLPFVLHAQHFQQPTPEELKMTSDPKAPGADAVYLDYSETDNDPLHYELIYARIKVLTDKGKQLATVDLPYLQRNYKIAEIKGRTIHPDGTIIPLTAKPEDLMSSKSGDQVIARKVFTLPSVTVGSILEYTYQINYADNLFTSPNWEIQGKYFVHHAHYEFTPYSEFMPNAGAQTGSSGDYLTDSAGHVVHSLVWWCILPKGVTVKQSTTSYSVDVADIPPAPDEEWMPPIQSVLYKVNFYYESTSNAQQFWIQAAKDWSKDVDKFAEPSKTIKQAVAGIVAPGDSDLVKAQKLYKAVQALDNTDYTRARSASEIKTLKLKPATHAADVWKQKSGSSNEIAMLYLAMARAAGLTAFAMNVADRSQLIFDPAYMDMDQLSDTLVLVGINGKGMLLDPGEKMCTFGQVSWTHAGDVGIRQSSTGPGFEKTPEQPYTENALERDGDIFLDEHGAITARLTFLMRGHDALMWRQEALEYDPDELKKRFDRWLQPIMPEGVEAHIDHFLGMDDSNLNMVAIVTAKGMLGTALPKRLLLPGQFFESQGQEPFVKEAKRMEPVDMEYSEETVDNVVYHLPAGFTVEGAPQDAKDLWQGHAEYVVKTVQTPGQITISRLLARAFDTVGAEDYQDLRGFYQKVAAADQSEMVLSSAAAATTGKGN